MKSRQEITTAKVAVIGLGQVGAAFSFALTQAGLARELILLDIDRDKAQGEALDLGDCLAHLGPMRMEAGDYRDCRDADIVVITAGTAQREGESRLDLAGRNAGIVRRILDGLLEHASSPLIIMVTNPVDIMTLVAQRASGLPPSRVFGSGTVLDSARFRTLLSENCGLDPRNVHAQVVGEHGDSEVLLWSGVHVSGLPLDILCSACPQRCSREDMSRQVRESAYNIIQKKGSTAYGIAVSLCRVVESILKDQHSVLTVSVRTGGLAGLPDVCLSLPAVVGAAGVERILDFTPEPGEMEALRHSARVLKNAVEGLDIQLPRLPENLPGPC